MRKTRTRTSKKKTKTRTTTGSSRVLAFLLLFGLVVFPASAEKKKKPPEAFALIAGTTFRPPGFALPGSKIRIEPGSKEAGGVKLKTVESVTDSRGEFAVRVPVVPMDWTVHVQANGYQPQARTVSIAGEQRVDLSFVLEPEQGQAKRGEGK